MKVLYQFLLIFTFCILFSSCTDLDDGATPSSTSELFRSTFSDTYSEGASASPSGNGTAGELPPSGVITAGEWNDLVHFSFWKNLLDQEDWRSIGANWKIIPEKRYSVAVKDKAGKPVIDARAILESSLGGIIWESRTDNTGQAELWLNIFEGNLQAQKLWVEYQDKKYSAGTLNHFEQGTIQVSIDVDGTIPTNIDIMFVVDATGSMGDELEFLKVELYDVINRIKSSNSGNQVRLGSVFYRDHGDEYVTRSFPFTDAYNTAINHIKKQSAEGGGDFPEAVDFALEAAIAGQQWSAHAITRLCFLILDAPPHNEPEVIDRIKTNIYKASKLGIKVIPITASGIDKDTEYLMRAFGLATNGTYVFITNHSGIGNDHLEATVGEYEVEYLNNLMVRLANKYSQIHQAQ